MALNFPNSPSNGDTATVGGISYTYNSSKNAWAPNTPTILGFDSDQVKTIITENTTSASVSISDSAPSSPSAGDLWFDSTVGVLYIYYSDGDSSQWVGISGNANAVGFDSDQVKSIITENSSGGVTSYDSEGAFSNGTSAGDFAFASDRKTLHVWNGTRWDRVYSGPDQILAWDSDGYPAENYNISDSDVTTISGSATDPDGFPVTYSYLTTPTNPVQVTNITNNGDGSFSLTRSQNADSDQGSFTFKFIATDGVHKITRNSVITLAGAALVDTNTIFFASFNTDFSATNYAGDSFTRQSGNNTIFNVTNAGITRGALNSNSESGSNGYGPETVFTTDIEANVGLTSSMTNWTIEFWSLYEALDSYMTQLEIGPASGSGGNDAYVGGLLYRYQDPYWRNSNIGSSNLDTRGNRSGTWTHHAIVGDNGTVRFYQGDYGSNSTQVHSISGNAVFNGNVDRIALMGELHTGSARYFIGKLINFRISNTARYPNGTSFNPQTEYPWELTS